mgnify:CR=1 FL=1
MTNPVSTKKIKRFSFKMQIFTNNPNPRVKNELVWVTESAMAYEEYEAKKILENFYKNHTILKMYWCRTETMIKK